MGGLAKFARDHGKRLGQLEAEAAKLRERRAALMRRAWEGGYSMEEMADVTGPPASPCRACSTARGRALVSGKRKPRISGAFSSAPGRTRTCIMPASA
jgi:hypothetical protein